jgi:hypothetical protein
VPTIKKQLEKMSYRPPRVELDPKKNFKAKKSMQRQQETLRAVQRLKEEKDAKQSEGTKA